MTPWTFKISKYGKDARAVYEVSIASADNAEIKLMWTDYELACLVGMLTHALKAELGERVGRLDISSRS